MSSIHNSSNCPVFVRTSKQAASPGARCHFAFPPRGSPSAWAGCRAAAALSQLGGPGTNAVVEALICSTRCFSHDLVIPLRSAVRAPRRAGKFQQELSNSESCRVPPRKGSDVNIPCAVGRAPVRTNLRAPRSD